MIAGDPALWDDFFKQRLIPAILAHVISTWDQMKKPDQSDLEDEISTKLYSALLNSKDRQQHAFLILRESVEIDTDLAKITGWKDINFYPSVPEQEEGVYFCLEAKRLNALVSGKRRPLAGEYVREGMQRFVNRQYSKLVHHGGMLGYVLDGKVAHAIKNVEANIRTHAEELGMARPGGFLSSTVRPDDPSTKETHHHRGNEIAVFRIHHLFVEGGS